MSSELIMALNNLVLRDWDDGSRPNSVGQRQSVISGEKSLGFYRWPTHPDRKTPPFKEGGYKGKQRSILTVVYEDIGLGTAGDALSNRQGLAILGNGHLLRVEDIAVAPLVSEFQSIFVQAA